MRFYTVPDARAARSSVLYATGFIGYFYLIIPIVGFGASALVGREIIRKVDTGGNMAAPLIAELLGGTPFLGFIAAVAFATILAVVAGLTLAGASALSHDIFVHAIRKGHASEHEQIRVARLATVAFGIVAVCSASLFKGQNVAFMVGLAFAVAASAKFPGAAAVDRLGALQYRRRRVVDRHRRVDGGRADRAEPDDLGRPAASPGRDLSAAESGDRVDAGRISRRDRRLARHPRARGGSAVSRREAANLSRHRRRIVSRGRPHPRSRSLRARRALHDAVRHAATRTSQRRSQEPPRSPVPRT